MLDMDLSKMLKNGVNRYELAAATAKRARQIVDEKKEAKEIFTEKPVSLAIEEYKEGKWTVEVDKTLEGRVEVNPE
jgi:DNA-directed RNA polymerase omega subunit